MRVPQATDVLQSLPQAIKHSLSVGRLHSIDTKLAKTEAALLYSGAVTSLEGGGR